MIPAQTRLKKGISYCEEILTPSQRYFAEFAPRLLAIPASDPIVERAFGEKRGIL
jgi:hypothetical protein